MGVQHPGVEYQKKRGNLVGLHLFRPQGQCFSHVQPLKDHWLKEVSHQGGKYGQNVN